MLGHCHDLWEWRPNVLACCSLQFLERACVVVRPYVPEEEINVRFLLAVEERPRNILFNGASECGKSRRLAAIALKKGFQLLPVLVVFADVVLEEVNKVGQLVQERRIILVC